MNTASVPGIVLGGLPRKKTSEFGIKVLTGYCAVRPSVTWTLLPPFTYDPTLKYKIYKINQ